MRVLYICTGNIYRSPIAEALTRKIHPEYEVESAGIDPLREIPRETELLLEEKGAQKFMKPRPDKVSQRAINEADRIVCMTDLHSEYIKRNFDVDPGKIKVWRIKDPAHYERELEKAFEQIERKIRVMEDD